MKLIFTITLFFLSFNQVFAQHAPVRKKFSFDSNFLNETREFWVGLPENYDSEKKYPTMYVMDAEWQFDIALAIMRELSKNDKIPDHIVIGIPKIDYQHRGKDLTFTATEFGSDGEPDSTAAAFFNSENTGGGMQFYKHLTEEVVPFINSRFLTNGFDVFIGHSLSGYYGAYIMTMDNPFNAFQLYDPSIWYNQGDAIKHFSSTFRKGFKTNVFISTAGGGRDRQQYNVDTHKAFHDELIKHKINSKLKVYNNENHGSVRLVSLIDGLSDLYDGFSIGYIFPTDTITVADADRHYQNFSKKVGFDFHCPVDAYRWIGYANYTQGNWVEAIKAYDLCGALDKDIVMMTELADCYFQTGAFALSLEAYVKVLGLDNKNEEVKLKIEEIKQLIAKEE